MAGIGYVAPEGARSILGFAFPAAAAWGYRLWYQKEQSEYLSAKYPEATKASWWTAMGIVLLVLIGLIAVIIGVAHSHERVPIENAHVDEYEISVQEIPAVFTRLKGKAEEATFTVFVFSPGAGPFKPEEAINLQFSFEDGAIGFDWVLLGPPNIRDQKEYEKLAASLGYKVLPKEGNGVHYLRTVDGDLPRLCKRVIVDLYGKKENSRVGLLTRGIKWP
jgi:hypothetical protein